MQQQTFRADQAGNRSEFGALVLEMSRIESSIGNHSEAAAYANEAAEAFEEDGQKEGAIAANATLAKEYRILDSPDLALNALVNLTRLNIDWAGGFLDMPRAKRIPDAEVLAMFGLIKSFARSYLGGGFIGGHNSISANYPAIYTPKGRLPSASAVQDLSEQFTRLNASRLADTDRGPGRDLVFNEFLILSDNMGTLWKEAHLKSLPMLGRLKTRISGI